MRGERSSGRAALVGLVRPMVGRRGPAGRSSPATDFGGPRARVSGHPKFLSDLVQGLGKTGLLSLPDKIAVSGPLEAGSYLAYRIGELDES